MRSRLAGTSLVFLSYLFALCMPEYAQNRSTSSNTSEQSLIQINAFEQSRPHSITLQDILSTREIRDAQISPDGKRVAFVVNQAFLEQNVNRSALFVMSTDNRADPIKLLEEQNLSQIRWTVD